MADPSPQPAPAPKAKPKDKAAPAPAKNPYGKAAKGETAAQKATRQAKYYRTQREQAESAADRGDTRMAGRAATIERKLGNTSKAGGYLNEATYGKGGGHVADAFDKVSGAGNAALNLIAGGRGAGTVAKGIGERIAGAFGKRAASKGVPEAVGMARQGAKRAASATAKKVTTPLKSAMKDAPKRARNPKISGKVPSKAAAGKNRDYHAADEKETPRAARVKAARKKQAA
jgi:hypothetical protein